MHVTYHINQLKKKYKKAVVAIGVFDGLHIGHQRLIKDVVKRAKAIKGTSIIVTFDPHPIHVLRPQENLYLIVSLRHRLKLIEKMGVNVCIVNKFTKRFSQMMPETFIKKYLIDKIHVQELYVGDDFRFGKNRRGTLDYLDSGAKKYGYHLNTIHVMKGGFKTVSSSKIRACIQSGKLYEASRLLNRPVSVLGQVIRGDAIGKTLGYPTINLRINNALLPPIGVYISRTIFKKKTYQSISYIGNKPSFNKRNKIAVETYLFHFKKSIYNEDVTIQFFKKIREEKVFSSLNELKKQIQLDEKKAKSYFRNKKF